MIAGLRVGVAIVALCLVSRSNQPSSLPAMNAQRPPVEKLALIGVGLIGGSVGLAAREHLGVEHVVGFDTDADVLAGGLEVGAITARADSVEEAVADADLVVLAVPVGALPDVARAALVAAREDAVVTDVGSTKREVMAAVDDPRFVGGHPIAGAETSGVENARAGLFEDATWFLTPAANTTGMGLERLMRFVNGLGAKARALDADTHDRLVADISHLPHVLANVLVSQAAQTIHSPDGSVTVIGPSFRDVTRVAGANTAIWKDIYLSNRDALADSLDAVIGRLGEFRDALRGGDETIVARINDQARADRQDLLERELVGGDVYELRVMVPNKPGILAELTLALGRAGVNIVDLALYPAADMSSGAVSIWVAGQEAAERTEQLVGELGYPVTRA
jgi:prephenate dehydrogenase